MEISSCNFFWKFSSIGHEIKQLTSSNILQNDGETVVGNLIFLFISCILPDTYKFNQILMIKLLHDVELMLESLESCGLFFVLFYSHKPSILVLA